MDCIDKIKIWRDNFSRMGSPADDYDRVRNHYCGFQIVRGKITFIKNAQSAILTPIVLLCSLINNRKKITVSACDAVFTCPNKRFLFVANDLPKPLTEKYQHVEVVVDNHMQQKDYFKLCIDKIGLSIYWHIVKKYPFAFFMNLSVLIHIARTYKLIRSFNPNAIISAQTEQDFTSSAVTKYCEKKGVENICIQHGEYSYNPSMAYVRFSEYWAWNKETISLLEEVNTSMEYAKIFTPDRLKPQFKRLDNPEYFITYYLEENEIGLLTSIKEALTICTNKGLKCKVRRHPREQNGENVIKVFEKSEIEIEDASAVPLKESMINSRYIVGALSTVLTEAIINGMEAVIDDVAVPIDYLELMSYVNLKRTPLRLSKIVNEVKKNR